MAPSPLYLQNSPIRESFPEVEHQTVSVEGMEKLEKSSFWPGVMAHIYNSSTSEAETGESL